MGLKCANACGTHVLDHPDVAWLEKRVNKNSNTPNNTQPSPKHCAFCARCSEIGTLPSKGDLSRDGRFASEKRGVRRWASPAMDGFLNPGVEKKNLWLSVEEVHAFAAFGLFQVVY